MASVTRRRCRGTLAAALVVASLLLLLREQPHVQTTAFFAPNDFLQQTKESVVASLSAEAAKQQSGQQAARIWFNLAVAQEARGAKDAAASSYEKALDIEPAHHLSNVNLALLLAQRTSPADLQRSEELLRRALESQRNPGALWNLGLVLERRGASGVASLKEASEAMVECGRTPRHLAMSLPLDEHGAEAYFASLQKELEDFSAFCQTSPALQQDLHMQQKLPAALRDIRRLPNDQDWLVTWGQETARLFGAEARAAAYGETLFSAWQQVIRSDAAVEEMLSRATASAVVMGSAHGYHCLFFRALGLPCLGYDLLQDSMVDSAKDVLAKHNIPQSDIDFHVGDAQNAPLRHAGMAGPVFLWLNDLVWPTEVRETVLKRAAAELPSTSLLVSYGPRDGVMPNGLKVLQDMRVPTSWSPDSGEQIALLQKC